MQQTGCKRPHILGSCNQSVAFCGELNFDVYRGCERRPETLSGEPGVLLTPLRSWLSVACKPVGELFFGDIAGSEPPKRQNALLFGRAQLKAVQSEEGYGNCKGCSLVAVDEWMIRNNSFCIASRQLR